MNDGLFKLVCLLSLLEPNPNVAMLTLIRYYVYNVVR